jgi:hypothetical protein
MLPVQIMSIRHIPSETAASPLVVIYSPFTQVLVLTQHELVGMYKA